MNEYPELPPSSMEIEQIRADIPRPIGFIPALIVFGFFALVAFAVCVPRGGSQEVTLPWRTGGGDAEDGTVPARRLELITVVPRDRIPAILNPTLETAEDAGGDIALDELIIGLEINGDARAYSTYQLSRHEIVNDVVGGVPVAVTW